MNSRFTNYYVIVISNLAHSLLYYRLIDESESEIEDVQIRTRPTRKYKKLPLALRSPFWTENNTIIQNVTAKEKIISEFAFTNQIEQSKKE